MRNWFLFHLLRSLIRPLLEDCTALLLYSEFVNSWAHYSTIAYFVFHETLFPSIILKTIITLVKHLDHSRAFPLSLVFLMRSIPMVFLILSVQWRAQQVVKTRKEIYRKARHESWSEVSRAADARGVRGLPATRHVSNGRPRIRTLSYWDEALKPLYGVYTRGEWVTSTPDLTLI